MTSKLKLELDELRVESFDTTAADGVARGTVRGNAGAYPAASADIDTCATQSPDCSWDSNCARSCPWTCAGDPVSCGGSCDGATCPDTCQESCYGSCVRTCGKTCENLSSDTCLFYTCGGCTTELPEYCWPR